MSGLEVNRWIPVFVLGFVDVLCFLVAAALATWIRFLSQFFVQELGAFLHHPGFLFYALGSQALLALTFDLYRPGSWKGAAHLFVRVLALAVSFALAMMLGIYLVPEWRFGRGVLLMTLVITLILELTIRFVWFIRYRRPTGRRAVLVGGGEIVEMLTEALESGSWAPFQILKVIPSEELDAASVQVEEALEEADLLVVAGLRERWSYERLAALNFRGITVVDAAAAFAELTGRIPVAHVDSQWFIASGDFSSLATSPFHQVQRLLDLSLTTLLLILGAPIFGLAAIGILLSDGFPVIYKQERLGRFRRPFTLYKLRTMKRSAEESGPRFAERKDKRNLWLGSFLRRWRIDELPQLINVLRGDMSLVGPRPERPDVTESLEDHIPFFAFRFSVRPGLTGWAQVNQPYCAELDEHRIKLEYDLYFLRSHGMMMYVLVLIKTLGALVFRAGR